MYKGARLGAEAGGVKVFHKHAQCGCRLGFDLGVFFFFSRVCLGVLVHLRAGEFMDILERARGANGRVCVFVSEDRCGWEGFFARGKL